MTSLSQDNNEQIEVLDSNDEECSSLYPSENFKLTTTPNDFNISTILSF